MSLVVYCPRRVRLYGIGDDVYKSKMKRNNCRHTDAKYQNKGICNDKSIVNTMCM